MLIPFQTETPEVATETVNPHRAELAQAEAARNEAATSLAEIAGERNAIAQPLAAARKELERCERNMRGAHIEGGARADLELAKLRLNNLEKSDAKLRERAESIESAKYESGLASGALRGWLDMNLTDEQVSELKAARERGQSLESLNKRARNLAYQNANRVEELPEKRVKIGETTASGNVKW